MYPFFRPWIRPYQAQAEGLKKVGGENKNTKGAHCPKTGGTPKTYGKFQRCDLLKVTNLEKCVSLWSRGQSPLNLLDVQFWRIYRLSTSPQTGNKRFIHNTGYSFLSLVATSLLSRTFWGKGRSVKNPEKLQAWNLNSCQYWKRAVHALYSPPLGPTNALDSYL